MRKYLGIILLILLIASLLRFGGIYPGHNRWHSDESIIYSSALNMVINNNLDPERYDYPALAAEINYVFFKFVFIPLRWGEYFMEHLSQIMDGIVHLPIAPLEARRTFYTYIVGSQWVNPMYWGRIVTALMGVGCVGLLYLLGKELLNERVGLISALLLTFNFKHVMNSHIVLPDIYNSFFLLVSLIFTLRLSKDSSKQNFILAGIFAGLSFSAKYQIFAIITLIFVILWKKYFRPMAILCMLHIPLMFLITNPYFFINYESAIRWVTDVSAKYGMGTFKLNLYPLWYMFNVDYGYFEFLLIPLGFALLIKKSLFKGFFLLSFSIPFLFMFMYYSTGGFYIRNFITITPVLLFLVAVVLDMIRPKWILYLILPIVLFIPAKNSLINVYYYAFDTWNYQKLTDWASKNLPPDTIVAAHPWDPPTGINIIKTEFELDGNYSLAEHRLAGAEYALINLDWGGNPFYSWMGGKIWKKPWEKMRNTYHGLAAEELFRYQVFVATKPWQAPDGNLILAKLPIWPKIGMKLITGNIAKPGHLYGVKIKRMSCNSDSFVRLDFYPNHINTISPRANNKSGWKDYILYERAPIGSRYLEAKVQGENCFEPLEIYESLDEIEDITQKPPYTHYEIDLNLLYPNSHGNL